MNKFPNGFMLSDTDRAKLLLAYQHLDESIKQSKLTYNDAQVQVDGVHHETCGNRVASIERKAS